MAKQPKPTPTQRQIMLNLQAGRRWDAGRPIGMSAAGGWDRSLRSIYRNGWLSPWSDELTDAGRAALSQDTTQEGER